MDPHAPTTALGTAIRAFLGRDLAASVAAEARRAGLVAGVVDAGPAPTVTDDDLAPLPATARRYLRAMGVVGRPRDRTFAARFRGRFRMRPNLPWMPMASFQFNTAEPVARIFHLRIDAAGVPLVGRDVYLDGHGLMHGRLLNVVTVVHGEGPELDVGELTTFLNDAVMLAPSMLLREAVTWTAVDDDRFAVALHDAGLTVRATVTVDGAGLPVEFVSDDRYAALPEGLVRAPWRTPMGPWTVVDGRPRAHWGSAVWDLADGPYEYGRFLSEPDDVAWNVVPPPGADGA